MQSRDDIGSFLNELGLAGNGAEIGVQCGKFAVKILSSWQGKCLCLIDPWRRVSDDIDPANVSDPQFEAYYKRARRAIKPYADRVRIMRMLSSEAAKEIAEYG